MQPQLKGLGYPADWVPIEPVVESVLSEIPAELREQGLPVDNSRHFAAELLKVDMEQVPAISISDVIFLYSLQAPKDRQLALMWVERMRQLFKAFLQVPEHQKADCWPQARQTMLAEVPQLAWSLPEQYDETDFFDRKGLLFFCSNYLSQDNCNGT